MLMQLPFKLFLVSTYLIVASADNCAARPSAGIEVYEGVPTYGYATGRKLELTANVQDFHGIKDLVTLAKGSTPFDLNGLKTLHSNVNKRNYQYASVQTESDYSSAFKIEAEVNGQYGGFSGSTSTSYTESNKLTSKSSMYFHFYNREVGAISLSNDATLSHHAEEMLKNDPHAFVESYGLYFISRMYLSCQAIASLTVISKTEQYKQSLDVEVEAKYGGMISASSEFTSDLEENNFFDKMTVDLFVNGGKPGAAASKLEDIKPIFDELDADGCTLGNAVITRTEIDSWLTHQAVLNAVGQNPEILSVLTPKDIIPTAYLTRFSILTSRTKALLDHAGKCVNDVYKCNTKQWAEEESRTKKRLALYKSGRSEFMKFDDKLTKVKESTLNDILFSLETEINEIYESTLEPAEEITSFTFTFYVTVLSSYDNYQKGPPGHPRQTNDLMVNFKIDPKRQDTFKGINMNPVPIDNGHANCRHYQGLFMAKFKNNVLSTKATWDRTCGSDQDTGWLEIFPANDYKYQQTYKTTGERLDVRFEVEYEPFAQSTGIFQTVHESRKRNKYALACAEWITYEGKEVAKNMY